MQNSYPILPDFDLHLFDGAAGGAAAGGSEGSSGTAPAQGETGALPKAETKKQNGSSRRSKTGAYDNVVFGRQEDAPAAQKTTPPDAGETAVGSGETKEKSGVSITSNTLEEKRKAFDALVDGEYKDQFTDRMQQAINRRFKEVKGMETSLAAQKPILDMLMQRYNIGDGDMAKLQTALEQDNEYWEGAAEKEGLTVDQYKAMKKLERENEEFRRMQQRQAGEQQAQQQYSKWYAEGERVKELYPSFDFRTEAANRDFLGLLKSGVSVQKAYELMHMEEIKASAAKAAAETAGQQMAAKIQSKAARPQENGMSSQSAVIVKNDVHNLSRADRAEIARRAQRGDKIRF